MCAILAFWCGPNEVVIESAIPPFPADAAEWDVPHHSDGSTYGEATIRRVLERQTEFYQHRGQSTEARPDPIDWPDPQPLSDLPPVERFDAGLFSGALGPFVDDKQPDDRGYLLNTNGDGLSQGGNSMAHHTASTNGSIEDITPMSNRSGAPTVSPGDQNGTVDATCQSDIAVERDTTRAAESPFGKQKKVNAKNLDPATVAARLIANLTSNEKNLIFWHGESYVYADGSHYRPLASSELRGMVVRCINERYSRLTTGITANVIDQVKAMTLISGTIEHCTWLWPQNNDWPADEIVVAANGHLRLTTIGPGVPRDEWWRRSTPRFFNLNALDFSVVNDAPLPVGWLNFLDQLWPNDSQSIATLQEWFGYILGGDTSLQKIMLIVGPKRSGKGTIARVLAALVGRYNVAGPTLASLAGNFGLSPLLHKPLAIISDARLSGRVDQSVIVERLLSISGEDALTIDRKFLDPVTCALPTRLMIFSNELPRLGDSSGAMSSRLIVLRLTESFFGRENTALTGQLLPELPGIFLWSIEGWRRLRSGAG